MPVIADDECPMGFEPTRYVQLEYIESNGTQYINTGFINNGIEHIKYDIDFRFIELTTQGGLWGPLDSTRSGTIWITPSQFTISAGATNSASSSVKIQADTNRHRGIVDINHVGNLKQSNYTFNFDGVNYDGVFEASAYYSNKPILLFRANDSRYSPVWARIYLFNIYINGVLAHDFIPVRRLFDNAIGMYDTVTETFFKNQGAGSFIAGPEVDRSIQVMGKICSPCPPNTYKDFVGNTDCTPCPEKTFSPRGSTELSECAKILHIGNYIAYMPVGRRTEHGLCTMFDGKKYCADMYEKE